MPNKKLLPTYQKAPRDTMKAYHYFMNGDIESDAVSIVKILQRERVEHKRILEKIETAVHDAASVKDVYYGEFVAWSVIMLINAVRDGDHEFIKSVSDAISMIDDTN